MITVYGADWCEDTQRSLRHLRRLGVPHVYINIDEQIDALDRAKALNHGERRTPTIDLGVGGTALVEPANDTLSEALIELQMLTQEQVQERLAVQNVGDAERIARSGAGAALLLASTTGPSVLRWPVRLLGLKLLVTGLTGWCPLYHLSGVTSLDGPGDRPAEARRSTWLAKRDEAGAAENARRGIDAPAPTPETAR
jgi:glutaredoxin